jgi:hypothetical protein
MNQFNGKGKIYLEGEAFFLKIILSISSLLLSFEQQILIA